MEAGTDVMSFKNDLQVDLAACCVPKLPENQGRGGEVESGCVTELESGYAFIRKGRKNAEIVRGALPVIKGYVEKLEGKGEIIVDGFSRMPLFFEGEINKELVFRNSVLEVENRKLKGVRRKSDKNLEDKITRELEMNRELNIRNKILQVENRNLRDIIKKA